MFDAIARLSAGNLSDFFRDRPVRWPRAREACLCRFRGTRSMPSLARVPTSGIGGAFFPHLERRVGNLSPGLVRLLSHPGEGSGM